MVESVEERFGVFAAMLRVEQVIGSSESELSESSGVGRSESGRLGRLGRRWGGGMGAATGEGESDGLFSLEAVSGSSQSESDSDSRSYGGEGLEGRRERVSRAKCGRLRVGFVAVDAAVGLCSPRLLADATAADRFCGMGAWMEVIRRA